jgi:two-component system response regulator FixJ
LPVGLANQCLVYLVDDDGAVRDSLKILLESYGMAVRDYGSADDFLRNFNPGRKGCVILDLHLPILGGLELLRMMRERKIDLPMIFITGRGDAETRARALEAGATAFFEKPVVEDVLMPAIDRALASRVQMSPAGQAGAEISAARLHPALLPS